MYKVSSTFLCNQVCVCLIVFNHVNEAFVCHYICYFVCEALIMLFVLLLLYFEKKKKRKEKTWNKVFYTYFRAFCRLQRLIKLIIIKISCFGVFFVIFVTGNCRFSNKISLSLINFFTVIEWVLPQLWTVFYMHKYFW